MLANPSASSGSWPRPNQTSGNLVFSGDDALVLYRGSELVDSFGRVGVDPGTAWVSGRRLDPGHDLRHQATVTTGRVDATAPFDPALNMWLLSGWRLAVWVAVAMVTLRWRSRPPLSARWISWCPYPPFQGPGSSTPLVPAGKFESEQAYTTRGVVTQVVSGLYRGFFIQDVRGTADPATSGWPLRPQHLANAAMGTRGRGVRLGQGQGVSTRPSSVPTNWW